MKLGICYTVFDGEELLEFAIKGIRKEVDFVSVTYQNISYFGNTNPNLLPLLEHLKSKNLIDQLLYYETNLSISSKFNEVTLRNLGLEASRKAGCSHHISADVDEFYDSKQLMFAKQIMEEEYDFCIAPLITYYKEPTFKVIPHLNLMTTLIHPVDNSYQINDNFPYHIDRTRRLEKFEKYRVFSMEEFAIHHMSYVRKDIQKKMINSSNGRACKIDKFVNEFNKYKVGERVCLPPDFINRRTVESENVFEINLGESWEHHQ